MKLKLLPVALAVGFILFNVFLYWHGHPPAVQTVQHSVPVVQHVAPVVHKAAPVAKHLPEVKHYAPGCFGNYDPPC